MQLATNTTAESLPTFLDAQELSYRHGNGKTVVEHLSLKLCKGDVLALLGLNGAGKTTTLRMLCGALVPNTGHVSIAGYSLLHNPIEAKQLLGYLPDEPPLYNDMKVREYLTLAARLRNLNGSTLQQRHQAVSELCQLTEVQGQLISQLSKGFRQRLGLAQALIHEPKVLILDEPSNGLDPQQLESLRHIVKTCSEHTAIILSTHLLSEARMMCNKVAIMHEGRLKQQQTINDDNLEALFQQVIS